MSDTASPAPVPAALLRGTLPPVAAATAAGLIGWILGSSTTVAGLAAAGVFAALAWGMGRSRAAVDPAVPTAPTGEPTAVSDAVDPSVATRASAGRVALACAAAVLLGCLLVAGTTAPTRMEQVAVPGVGLAVALAAYLAMRGSLGLRPSTAIMASVVLNLAGLITVAGSATLGRRAVGVAVIALAWALATVGAERLSPSRPAAAVAVVGAVTALCAGWLMGAATVQVAFLASVILLAPMAITAIWAEVLTMAADRYLGEGRPPHRRR